jgi:hypothetical protein
MNRGYVRLWRRFLDDGYLQNANLCVFMLWCLLKASHKQHAVTVGLQRVALEPGEFIFTLRNAAKDLKMSLKQIRVIVATLKNGEFLALKTTNKFSVITIVNWQIYQETEEEKGTPKGTLGAHQGHIYKNGKNGKKVKTPLEDFSVLIPELGKRYSDRSLLERVFQALASTRKTGKISDSATASILRSWLRYPPEQVLSGIRIYLERDYAGQGKDEKYLLGIIRRRKEAGASEDMPGREGDRAELFDPDPGRMMRRSSGSRILDRHYESEGWTIVPAGREPPRSTGSLLYDRRAIAFSRDNPTVAGREQNDRMAIDLNRGDRSQRAAGGDVKA